jgi:hypothetical protein
VLYLSPPAIAAPDWASYYNQAARLDEGQDDAQGIPGSNSPEGL